MNNLSCNDSKSKYCKFCDTWFNSKEEWAEHMYGKHEIITKFNIIIWRIRFTAELIYNKIKNILF